MNRNRWLSVCSFVKLKVIWKQIYRFSSFSSLSHVWTSHSHTCSSSCGTKDLLRYDDLELEREKTIWFQMNDIRESGRCHYYVSGYVFCTFEILSSHSSSVIFQQNHTDFQINKRKLSSGEKRTLMVLGSVSDDDVCQIANSRWHSCSSVGLFVFQYWFESGVWYWLWYIDKTDNFVIETYAADIIEHEAKLLRIIDSIWRHRQRTKTENREKEREINRPREKKCASKRALHIYRMFQLAIVIDISNRKYTFPLNPVQSFVQQMVKAIYNNNTNMGVITMSIPYNRKLWLR